MSKQSGFVGLSGGFHVPNIAGRQYAPGWQPNSPGESSPVGWPGAVFQPTPWPNAVQSLSTLANFAGIPRARGELPVNNRFAELPSNYLFMSGFVGKSLGG